MAAIAQAAKTKQNRTGVEPDVVRIGKDVIELLTSGMYVSPITVYREYVQNAADGIDARLAQGTKRDEPGRVTITIDHEQRTVRIKDNGAAIPASEAVATLLAVGGSRKRGTMARGFRGIGRLSGLAYCRELEFHCKAAGDDVMTCISWDGVELRRRLRDGTTKDDLRSIVTSCVAVWTEPADRADHSFEVIMRDVARHRHDLLVNERMIAQYLGQVSPVPFHPSFSFGAEIEAQLKKGGLERTTIALEVNGEEVYRPFLDQMTIPGSDQEIRIDDVEFATFADVDGEVGAIAWLGHHEYVRGIPSGLGIRGLRGRVGDVQVGEANLFDGLYKEPRFNGWTIGEVHVLDRRIVPNARRDDFEVNHHAYNLTAQLASVAMKIANRCRTTSIGRNAELTIRRVIDETKTAIAGDEPFEVAVLKDNLKRTAGKLRVIPDEVLRARLDAELKRTEAALENHKHVPPPSSLRLDKVKSLIMRTLKNRGQARALIEKLERMAARG